MADDNESTDALDFTTAWIRCTEHNCSSCGVVQTIYETCPYCGENLDES